MALNEAEKPTDFSLYFWMSLGPLATSAAFLLAPENVLPIQKPLLLTAFAAMPLCWLWKQNGMKLLICGLLFLTLFYHYFLPQSSLLWNLSLWASMALACVSTSYAMEELGFSPTIASRVESEDNPLLMTAQNPFSRALEVEKELRSELERKGQLLQNAQRENAQLLPFQELAKKREVELKQLNVIVQQCQEEVRLLKAKMSEQGELTRRFIKQKEEEHVNVKLLQLDLEKKERLLQHTLAQLGSTRQEMQQQNVNREILLQLEKDLSLSQSSVKELNKEKFELESQQNDLRKEFAKTLQSELKAKEQLLQETVVQLGTVREELQQQRQSAGIQLQHVSQELHVLRQTVHGLHSEREIGQRDIAKQRLEIESLTTEKNLISESLQQATTKLQELDAQLEKQRSEKQTTSAKDDADIHTQYAIVERALRRSEGQYKQLRQQFEDKSLLLHQTRQRLFRIEEELQHHSLAQQEKEKYLYSEDSRYIDRHLTNIEKEFNEMVSDYQHEIEGLSSVINALVKNL